MLSHQFPAPFLLGILILAPEFWDFMHVLRSLGLKSEEPMELLYGITGQTNSEQGGQSENRLDSKRREAECTGMAQGPRSGI